MNKDNLTKITIKKDNHTETVWALKEENWYRIKNIPSLFINYAYDDLVVAESIGDNIFVTEVFEDSIYSTVRLINVDPSIKQALLSKLSHLKCIVEESCSHNIGIGIPTSIEYYHELRWYFEKGDRMGLWQWHEGIIKENNLWLRETRFRDEHADNVAKYPEDFETEIMEPRNETSKNYFNVVVDYTIVNMHTNRKYSATIVEWVTITELCYGTRYWERCIDVSYDEYVIITGMEVKGQYFMKSNIIKDIELVLDDEDAAKEKKREIDRQARENGYEILCVG